MGRGIKDYIGVIGLNNNGRKMKIIKNRNNGCVDVEFDNGYIKRNVRKWCFDNGKVKNPYDATVYDVGFEGIGKFKLTSNKRMYKTWQSMLQRCYDNKLHDRLLTYKDCIVCDEWHNFQNFAKWYEENYYKVDGERMALDKDILIKGNKVYSPDTCIFVPNKINLLFTKTNKNRGNLPIGVSSKNGKFIVNMKINDKFITCASFNTPQEAFNVYKTHKENHIKEVADLYKNKIPKKLYDSLYNYTVEIID